MTGSPTPSEESPLAAEAPPSYDFATTLPADESTSDSAGPGPSSSNAAVADSSSSSSAIKINPRLFSGPPNAEPLYGSIPTSLGVLGGIEASSRGWKTNSWDPRLNDAQVLYDYLRYRAQARPGFKLQCTGAHWVHHDSDTTVYENGVPVQKRKGQSDRVVDFDFFIDLSDILNHPDNTSNVHLAAIAPDLPAYRGTHTPTYSSLFAPPEDRDYYSLQSDIELGGESTTPGKEVTGSALNLWQEAKLWRIGKGEPWWSNPLVSDEFWATRRNARPSVADRLGGLVTRSVALRADEDDDAVDEERGELVGDVTRVREQWDQPTLKAWCEAYVAKRALLKEFSMFKEVWGWDLVGLESAVRGAIVSTGYNSNDLTVVFELDDRDLTVHHNNLLSRLLGNTLIYILLWITLLYPFIWAFKRFHHAGGAPFNVARATYGLKYYPPLPSTFPAETVQAAEDRLPSLYKLHPELPKNPTLVRGPKGVHYLLGRKEGEFFREWEERIRMGVNMRFKGQLMGTRVGDRESLDLDGY